MDFFENADMKLSSYGGLSEADSLLPSDCSDAIFGPYTKNEFLNVSKILNATNFFTFAPVPLQTYYWSIVRRNLEWYYGYVYGIHNGGVLSSKIASKICKMSAQLTMSGGIKFEGDEKATAFMEKWATKNKVQSKLKQKAPIHNAIGFTLAKLDCDLKGNLNMNFVQGNRYFAQTNDNGDVMAFYCVIQALTSPIATAGNENMEGYYLVEERYFKNASPVQRYRMYKGPIIATAPVYGEQSAQTKGIPFEQLEDYAKSYVFKKFKGNVLNKEYKLPFKDLGAVVLKNTYSSTGMDDYSCFSDSTIADVHSELYEYDLTKTQKNESKYLSQDFVAMPDHLIPPMGALNDEQRALALELAGSSGFNKRLVKKARGIDPQNAVPFVYQPQLKTDSYNNDINQILNEIAAGAQFSPSTLAGYLKNGVERTAREVTADENATRLTVKDKRKLLSDGLNCLIKTVLTHYGIVDAKGYPFECTLAFKDETLTNPMQELELLEKKQQNGWISKITAIETANPNLTKKEAEEEFARIKEDEQSGAFGQGAYNDANYFGGADDEERIVQRE